MTPLDRAVAILSDPLVSRILEADRVMEDGMTANPNTYRMNDKVHVRLLGEDRTLCGVRLRPDYDVRWQFCSRGRFGESLPHSFRKGIGRPEGWYPACKRCLRHPIIIVTRRVEDAQREILHTAMTRRATRDPHMQEIGRAD